MRVEDFVERRDESFYIAGTRVPLACVVREFRDGQSAEAIRSAFPTLTLEQVYGAITDAILRYSHLLFTMVVVPEMQKAVC
jgi:hypothetical protein